MNVGASERSAGQRYMEACRWQLDADIPENIETMTVQICDPVIFTSAGCSVVFSGLDSSVAGKVEQAFRQSDIPVFSNAKNFRMHPDVPLVVPFVNPHHLDIVGMQRRQLKLQRGFIVTNANCSTTGLVVTLKPLHDIYGIVQANVVTMQAISGAGYPGISSLDIIGNVVPYIGDEEDKIEEEPLKILGEYRSSTTEDGNAEESVLKKPDIMIDATCNRVPVIDGHTECISLKLKRQPTSMAEVTEVLENYRSSFYPEMQLIKVHTTANRPQPRLDLMRGGGYCVSVGRLRTGKYWDLQFTLLSHNTILGAAGSAIKNAEIALRKKLI